MWNVTNVDIKIQKCYVFETLQTVGFHHVGTENY